jgi:twitching motility protein PilT
MLGESLKGVFCQQLLRKADGKGRVSALEILICNAAVANLIREGKTFQVPSIMQTAKGDGMQLMDQHILELLKSKHISGEEATVVRLIKKPFKLSC